MVDLRPMRFDGERKQALAFAIEGSSAVDAARAAIDGARTAVVAYGVAPEGMAARAFHELGCASLGPAPEIVRRLRLGAMPLLMPFRRQRQSGVREILVDDPRVTRLWDRFSIDIPVGVERNARWFGPRIFGGGKYRVLVFEDGDRYVIRALCAFRVVGDEGIIAELLHDRSLAGMRAASHLCGLTLRELSDAGATLARAWSLPHSGSFPIFMRHAFVPHRSRVHVGVRALDREVEHLVSDRRHWYLSGLDFLA